MSKLTDQLTEKVANSEYEMPFEATEVRQAVEPLIVAAATLTSSIAGYAIACSLLRDGKLALVGVPIGGFGFAIVASGLVWAYQDWYRTKGGSPLLVCLTAWTVAILLSLI